MSVFTERPARIPLRAAKTMVLFAVVLAPLTLAAKAERMRLYAREAYAGAERVYLGDHRQIDPLAQVNSAKVITGRWLLCSEANYAGDCVWISRDVPSFHELSFKGVVASLRPERAPVLQRQWGDTPPPPRTALALFAEPNFRGEWIALRDSTADLSKLETPIKPASIVVQKTPWRVCTEPNFKGSCLSMTASSWDLRSIFSTQIKSAQPLP